MNPKVTVIMPVLNGQKYIGEAIESIISQTYKDFELIVINDGSTDGTADILKAFSERVELVCIRHDTPHGIARSVNDGIRVARGRFIAFLDHDDLWFPEFLATQMAYLDRHPDAGMVHSDFQTVDGSGHVLEASVANCRNRTRVSGHVFPALFMDSFIVGNSVLIRKECFDRLGGFDTTLRIGDYHMWLRIARHYQVGYTPRVLTAYRQHQTQDSRTFSAEEHPPGLMAIESILELYPEIRRELGEQTIRHRTAALYWDVAHALFSKGHRQTARMFLVKAIRSQPVNIRYYGVYAASFLQPSQTLLARKVWHVLQRFPTPFRPAHGASDET